MPQPSLAVIWSRQKNHRFYKLSAAHILAKHIPSKMMGGSGRWRCHAPFLKMVPKIKGLKFFFFFWGGGVRVHCWEVHLMLFLAAPALYVNSPEGEGIFSIMQMFIIGWQRIYIYILYILHTHEQNMHSYIYIYKLCAKTLCIYMDLD